MAIKPITQNVLTLVLVTILLALAGCEDEDEILRKWNRESTEKILEQNSQVVEGSKQLVEADAQARREIVELQRDLQQERVELGQQRDLLEEERKDLADERQREPVLAAVISGAVWLIVCALPLILCWSLLHGLRNQNDTTELEEMLTVELVDEDSVLANPARITRLPAPEEDSPALLTSGDPQSD
jgi:hypothetical protein